MYMSTPSIVRDTKMNVGAIFVFCAAILFQVLYLEYGFVLLKSNTFNEFTKVAMSKGKKFYRLS